MSIIAMNQTKKSVTASAHLPYGAYKQAVALASAVNGKIGRTEDNRFTVTFDKVKTATEFVTKWTADYAAAHKAYTKAQEPKAPKSTKTTKTTSSSKKTTKGKGKGNTFDFSKIKGKTTSDKNKALHKALVSMGIADSRTPEYMSVWNARPWSK